MLIDDRIIAAGKMFEDRLDAASALWALDYVNFGECAVAIDMLADQSVDHEVRLTVDWQLVTITVVFAARAVGPAFTPG